MYFIISLENILHAELNSSLKNTYHVINQLQQHLDAIMYSYQLQLYLLLDQLIQGEDIYIGCACFPILIEFIQFKNKKYLHEMPNKALNVYIYM